MIKVNLLEYKKRKCWSAIKHNYFISDTIENQIWERENVPLKTIVLSLQNAIEVIKKNPGDCKAHRNTFFKFDIDYVPLKEFVGLDKWSGVIYIDLDLDKDPKIIKLNNEQRKALYGQLDFALQELLPHNYCYMEHSSSGIGIHALFYFDCIKNKENYNLYAEYVYSIFRYKIDAYIENFSHIFIDPVCLKSSGKSKIFDDVYKRPYQKFYMTTIDYIYHNVDGDISSIEFKLEENEDIEDELNESGDNSTSHVDVKFITSQKKYTLDHNDRLYVLTALKRYVGDKPTAYKLWYDFCQQISLYKSYKTKDFINMFEKLWDKIDETTGHINILRKYGFVIDDKKTHIDLGEGYLGDKRELILSLIQKGINFVQAPTGGGKTRFWTDYNLDLIKDVLNLNKPILIVEPLNSIINTKYDDTVITITGSKRFPRTLLGYGMYVTNYNKLLKKGVGDTWEIRDDIDEFLSQFGLIVLDESHILIKDSFRCNVLIPFINSIKKAAEHSKIILQTATPMNEDQLFFINNYIICHKQNNITTKWIYRRCIDDKFEISQITCLVNYYVHNGRKVYVYWNNASLNQLHAFKATYTDPDKVAVYHKRNTGEESMSRITNYHRLKYEGNEDNYEYDVLLSSVYFGVGNDLDDETDAAVIIIGNNTWQEDIQAVGRWRNSKDVEVCQIILPNEYEFIENTAQEEFNINSIRKEQKDKLNRMWHDKLSKDKSIIINHKTYQITKAEDIDILSIMSTADVYYSQFKVKTEALSNEYYGYRIKDDYTKPLECNYDFTNANKEYWKEVKNERNINKKNIMDGNIDYDVINKDTKLIKFKSLWDQLKRYEIDKLLGPKYISASTHYNMLKCWVDYYRALLSRNIDYPEIYSLLWYRKRYNKETKDDIIDINGFEVTEDEYNMFLSYIIYIHNKNKGCKDYDIKANYIMPFKYNCKLFVDMPDELIDKLYSTYAESELDISASKEFFSDYEWKDEAFESTVIHNMKDILNQTEHMNKELSKIQFIFKMFFNNCKIGSYIGSKIGGKKSSPKKKLTIIEEFPEKYKLKIGQEFDSATDLAIYANVSNKTVSQWISKSWVSKSK